MNIAIITLFPEMFTAITQFGVCSRAFDKGLVNLRLLNPRDFTSDRHQTVDDRPYGGGPGMVMMIEPLERALRSAKEWLKKQCEESEVRVVYMSPQGRVLNQQGVKSLGDNANLVLIAGRYEGIDERFIDRHVDEEWSIGDYVLSGGELPAMVLMDAMLRFVPGVLGDSESAEQDSFMAGLLDCPHYTRPEQYGGVNVPNVLLSGNHKKIEDWRLSQSLGRTLKRRPDLLQSLKLDKRQRELLDQYSDANENN